MKAQYAGDIGDFGKVLILKHLAGLGFKIGVNWVMTENDGRGHGEHRDYVDYRGKDCLCCCDEKIFEQMLPLAKKERSDRKLEDLEILIRGFSENIVFYSKKYIGGAARKISDDEAFAELSPDAAELVFFDPDNGVGGEEGTSCEHVYLSDLKRYWNRKQSLLTYHHLSREGAHDEQVKKIKSDFQRAFPNGLMYAYQLRRGTARVFILCVREEHLCKILGTPAIEPLMKTKDAWAKRGKYCDKDHSAKPAPTGTLPSPSVSAAFDPAAFSKGYTVNASPNSTTRTGYVNKSGQVVIRNTGLSGTDHRQSVYQLGCSHCGHAYGANGTDIHLRNCPNCQRGKPGLPLK